MSSLSLRDGGFVMLSVVLAGLTLVATGIADEKQTIPAILQQCWAHDEKGIDLHPYFQIGILDTLHCSMTQFFHGAAASRYGGTITGLATLVAYLPWLVFVTLEAGRQGAKGLIRYSLIVAGILQMGAGFFLLGIYIPLFIYGRSKEHSPLSKQYILYTLVPPLLYTTCALLTFFAKIDSMAWKVSTTLLCGSIILSFIPSMMLLEAKPVMKDEESRRLSIAPYILTATIAFVIWLGLLFLVVFTMKSDFHVLYETVWKSASSPMVKVFLVDAIAIWMASLLLSVYLKPSALKEFLFLGALFGPGFAIAMVLAMFEIDDLNTPATTSGNVTAKKED